MLLPSPRGSTPHASASSSISTSPRPEEASSPGRRLCGRSSLVSVTSTRSRRAPGSPRDLGDSSASASVCTRTLVSISETSSTAESTWSATAQSCSRSRSCWRATAIRSGSACATVSMVRRTGGGTVTVRRAAALARPAQQQHRDVVLAAVGQRARGVVRGGAVHGLDEGVGASVLQVALVLLQDRRGSAASRSPGRGRRSRSARRCRSAWSRRAPGRAGWWGSRRPGRCRAAGRPPWAGPAPCRPPSGSPGRGARRGRCPGCRSPGRPRRRGRSRSAGRAGVVPGSPAPSGAVRHAVQEAGGAGEHRVGAVALGGVGAQGDPELAHQARPPARRGPGRRR